MKCIKRLSLATAMGIWVTFTSLGRAADFWVSPSGNDDNSGNKDAPVATLNRAMILERKARVQDPISPVTVWLAPGDYPVEEGWALSPEDSGTADAPVIWRSVEKGKARLVGCHIIAPEKWKPLDDPDLLGRLSPKAQGKIMQLDIAEAGLHPARAFPDYSVEPMGSFALFFWRQETAAFSLAERRLWLHHHGPCPVQWWPQRKGKHDCGFCLPWRGTGALGASS